MVKPTLIIYHDMKKVIKSTVGWQEDTNVRTKDIQSTGIGIYLNQIGISVELITPKQLFTNDMLTMIMRNGM